MTPRLWFVRLGHGLFAALLALAMAHPAGACTARAVPASVLGKQLGITEEGSLAQAWSCTDAGGEHVLTISRVASSDRGQGTQLLFVKRTRTATGWRKAWQARDFVAEPMASAPGPELVMMKDVDSDGLADIFIAYALPRPTAASDEGKLLIYYKDHKYAIRGAIARTPDDFGSRKLDPAFGTLPQPLQLQALKLWDQLSLPPRTTAGWGKPVQALSRR